MPDTLTNSNIIQGLLAVVVLMFGFLITGIKWLSTRQIGRIDKHDTLHENHIISFNGFLAQIQETDRAHGALEMQVAMIKETQDKAELRHQQALKEQRQATDRMIDAMVKNFEGMFERQQKAQDLIIQLLSKE